MKIVDVDDVSATLRRAPLSALLESLKAAPSDADRHRFLDAFLAVFNYVYPASCVHEWQLQSPNGPLSGGICKKCGTTGEFANSNGWKREGRGKS